jgi:histidinol-phosphate aminotransferase
VKYQLPENIRSLTPYEPISGNYHIRLDANESYFSLSDDQVATFQQLLTNISYNRYPDPTAAKLCKAFADYYGIDANYVTAFDGSDESLALLSAAFFAPGQKLGVFRQDFSMYQVYAQIYNTEYVVLDKNDDLTIDVDYVLQRIENDHISALLFSNPCNPTSVGLKREDVIRLIESTDALIIVDEAYMDFWNQSVLDLAGKYENLIVLKTCSKAIGLASVRIGFTITSVNLTNCLRAIKSPYNVNTISQEFGAFLLSQKEYLQNAAKEIIQNRNWLQQQFDMLAIQYPAMIERVYPSDTNFIYLKTPAGKMIYDSLLKRSIAIRYMGDYLRISVGSQKENEVLMTELQSILLLLSKEDSK